MNIFATDLNPKEAALALDNRRGTKLILECAQMLSTALRVEAPEYAQESSLYRMAHRNHPCSIWARETDENFLWLLEHMKHMFSIHHQAFGSNHSSMSLVPFLEEGARLIPPGRLLPFANCARNSTLGLDYSKVENPVDAYREYLLKRYELDGSVRFKRHDPPDWVYDAANRGRFNIV